MTASSDPSAQQTATKQSWKANFSQKQLERKRHVDRISQRRNRQKSKETATLFKDKMDLLVEGDHKTLLERMSMENDAMKAKLDMFKAKFEHVHRISKECLQVDADSDCSRFSNPSSSIFVSPERETTANSSAVDGQLGNVSDMLRRSFSQQPSIFFGIMEAMEHGSDLESQEISSHRFIETVLAWKYSKGLTDGLDYLARHYNLRGLTEDFAKDDVLYSKITTSDFYSTLLRLLHNHPGTVGLDQPVRQGPREILSPSQDKNTSHLDLTRRRTAFLAYQLVLPWQDFCRSHMEQIALFWAQYRHLLIFVFPSTENLEKCPVWYRPEPTRLLRDNPGCIDFMIWSRASERLIKTWRDYDTVNLIGNFIKGFSICTTGNLGGPLVYAKNDNELELSESFEKIIAPTSNFHEQSHFLARYTDLAADIYADSCLISVTSPSGNGAVSSLFPTSRSMLDTRIPLRGREPVSFSGQLSSYLYPTAGYCSHLGATVADVAADFFIPIGFGEPQYTTPIHNTNAFFHQTVHDTPPSWFSNNDEKGQDHATVLTDFNSVPGGENDQLAFENSDAFGLGHSSLSFHYVPEDTL